MERLKAELELAWTATANAEAAALRHQQALAEESERVLALEGALDDGKLKFRPMVLPDSFIETATQFQQYDQAGLNAKHIVGTVNKLMDRATVPAV